MLIEIIYVIITAAVVMYLMLKWLPYIPVLAHALTASREDSAYISARIPGEASMSQQVQKAAGRASKNITLKIRRSGGGKA